jgi:RimJ/RimL family protein N-acetyltransferase
VTLPASPRLAFAPHRPSDFDDSAAMWGDAELRRHMGGNALTPEEVWARLLRHVGHWELFGYGYWVVRDRDGRFVGEVGFADLRRDTTPRLVDPEAGWVIARWAHGRGYATEAMRAALAWADARFARTTCIIDPDNAASIRVADKCGYVLVARGRYGTVPTLVYARSRA